MADTDYFIPATVAVQSLACSMISTMMYKNSYGKFLMYANYRYIEVQMKWINRLIVTSLCLPTEFWASEGKTGITDVRLEVNL